MQASQWHYWGRHISSTVETRLSLDSMGRKSLSRWKLFKEDPIGTIMGLLLIVGLFLAAVGLFMGLVKAIKWAWEL